MMKRLSCALFCLILMMVCLFACAETLPDTVTPFTTTDLQGNVITEQIFSQKDLTVLNMWGTYCSPCIREMPELAAWAKEMPDNIQFITLVIDVNSINQVCRTYNNAQMILNAAGAEFTTMIYTTDMDQFLNRTVGVPTTMFIDKNGRFVHEDVVGAYVFLYKQAVDEILSSLTKK